MIGLQYAGCEGRFREDGDVLMRKMHPCMGYLCIMDLPVTIPNGSRLFAIALPLSNNATYYIHAIKYMYQ